MDISGVGRDIHAGCESVTTERSRRGRSSSAEIITRLTETMVDIEGEAMRPVTWVVVEEVNSGEWGIGGKGLTTQDVKDLQASGK